MKILYLGTTSFSRIILESLINEGFDIVSVITKPDTIVRGKAISTKVAEIASNKNIPCYKPLFTKEVSRIAKSLDYDILVCAAYGKILQKELLDNRLSLNVHASLLPKYRGASPIQTALFNDDSITGVTIMKMAEKLDAGPMISLSKIEILPEDNFTSLEEKLAHIGAKALIEVLKDISNGKEIAYIDQDDSMVSYCPLIDSSREHLCFDVPVKTVINTIRALNYTPSTYAIVNNTAIKIVNAKKSDIIIKSAIGSVLVTKKNIYLRCLDGSIEILNLQLPGKKVMATSDFLNGYSIIKSEDVFK